MSRRITTELFSISPQAVVLPDHWVLGYPEGPEMNENNQQVQQFEMEWKQMLSALPIEFLELEIGEKRPEDLLQEVVFKMESKCTVPGFYYIADFVPAGTKHLLLTIISVCNSLPHFDY